MDILKLKYQSSLLDNEVAFSPPMKGMKKLLTMLEV